MASSEGQKSNNNADESLKVAIAMALFRSKLLQNPKPPSPTPPPPTDDLSASSSAPLLSDALKWRRKAKERKQLILRLKEDLKQAEDGLQYDLFPQTASCKCYFLDNFGKLSPKTSENNSQWRFNDVLRRRFLRRVRLHERMKRRTDDSTQKQHFSDCNDEDELEHLRASVDFLVELCDTVSSVQVDDGKFVSMLHQAVDFILDASKNLSTMERNIESIEGIVNSLIMRLTRSMCATMQGDEIEHFGTNAQFHIQHLMRKLGSEPYVGQRVILSVSQRICVVAESLIFMDPFDDAFPNMHRCMYTMIQLIEYLISDNLVSWSSTDGFDTRLFEEWATSLFQAQKTVKLLESRNGLYVLYMDRVIGVVAKIVGQVSALQNLKPDILDNLFR